MICKLKHWLEYCIMILPNQLDREKTFVVIIYIIPRQVMLLYCF